MIRKSNVYSPLFIPILFLTRQCSPMYLLYQNSQNLFAWPQRDIAACWFSQQALALASDILQPNSSVLG